MAKQNISISDLTPELLERIRKKTNNNFYGVTIPKFNLNAGMRVKYDLNLCDPMTFLNALNISGQCGKKEDVRFPWRPQSTMYSKESEWYKYDSKCIKCMECCCPPDLRNKCIEESKKKVVVKKKIPIKK